jgi:hypothetical protein
VRIQASRVAPLVGVGGMQPIDLMVCFIVEVNAHGSRFGNGADCSDIKFALLVEAGLVGDQTIIVTAADELQVVDKDLPNGTTISALTRSPPAITTGATRRRLVGERHAVYDLL